MTNTSSAASRESSPRPAQQNLHTTTPPTIFRDLALHNDAPFTEPGLFATDDSDRIAPLLQIGLAALMLPTVAYSLTMIWSSVTNGTLHAAVRAILP